MITVPTLLGLLTYRFVQALDPHVPRAALGPAVVVSAASSLLLCCARWYSLG